MLVLFAHSCLEYLGLYVWHIHLHVGLSILCCPIAPMSDCFPGCEMWLPFGWDGVVCMGVAQQSPHKGAIPQQDSEPRVIPVLSHESIR